MVIVEILKDSGDDDNKRLVISRSQDITLEIGDRIRCVSGHAVVIINQAVRGGSYIISEESPISHKSEHRSLLEITAEVAKTLSKGESHPFEFNKFGHLIKNSAATVKKITEKVGR